MAIYDFSSRKMVKKYNKCKKGDSKVHPNSLYYYDNYCVIFIPTK